MRGKAEIMGQFLQGTVSFVPTLLIAIVVFGVLGMCYWEIFGKF